MRYIISAVWNWWKSLSSSDDKTAEIITVKQTDRKGNDKMKDKWTDWLTEKLKGIEDISSEISANRKTRRLKTEYRYRNIDTDTQTLSFRQTNSHTVT